MKRVFPSLVLCIVACPTVAQHAPGSEHPAPEFTHGVAEQRREARLRLAERLESALAGAADFDRLADSVARIVDSDAVPERVASLVSEDAPRELPMLKNALTRAISDLRFRPTAEAPIPLDWPPTSPVGEVVLKRYPKYRMAATAMRRGSETMPFWRLFGHIKSNDIAMTAPVQMDRASDESGVERMAFLYREESLGPLGDREGVEVVDVMPTLAVSIGERGFRSEKRVDVLEARLRRWIEERRGEFEASGPVRVMGYNSPSVRGSRRFYEVEIPVRRSARVVRADAASDGPTASK